MPKSLADWSDLIFRQIDEGRGVLVLGAGATATSLDEGGKTLKTGIPLAQSLASEAGFEYAGEGLSEVVSAVEAVLGKSRTRDLIVSSYRNCSPSEELQAIFKFCWKRIYTFNVDDAIESIPRKVRSQEFRVKNALKDRVSESEGIGYCEIVHLNGSIREPSVGFVFSSEDYSRAFNQIPPWYVKAGDDYIDHTIFFIGTNLNEPLLASQIERAKVESGKAGVSFLITPDEISSIRAKSLEAHGIIHVRATLEDFTKFLSRKYPDGVKPKDVLTKSSGLVPPETTSLSAKDISALNSFSVIDHSMIVSKARRAENRVNAIGKQFFDGFPPTWEVVSAGAYIKLDSYKSISSYIQNIDAADDQLLVVLGDSGAGKTTGLMHAVAERLRKSTSDFVLEYRDSGRPLLNSCHVLGNLYRDRNVTILIEPLNVYADDISLVLSHGGFKNLRFISSARIGEWNDRFAKSLGQYSAVLDLERFGDNEIDKIIENLDRFLPSPSFAQLDKSQKYSRIQKARRQLLMMFKEISGGKLFDIIIADEYANISRGADKVLFVAIGLASLARVGLPIAAARYIKRLTGSTEPLESTLERLGTMTNLYGGNRLFARHELYVRHIIEAVAEKGDIHDAMRHIGMFFSQYEAPIVRHVDRRDYQLFKYVLNEDNLRRFIGGSKDSRKLILSLFEALELPFQRDGHFWLQYGLFHRSIGDQVRALELLTKSCQAFPENDYAQHALAQQKLMLSAAVGTVDRVQAFHWIREAVAELTKLDARQAEVDQNSAIWTLAKYHIKALRVWSEHETARNVAKGYFEKFKELVDRYPDIKMESARNAMLLLASTGQYTDLH